MTTTGVRQVRVQCLEHGCQTMVGWTTSEYCFMHYKKHKRDKWRAYKWCLEDTCHNRITGDFFCDKHSSLEHRKKDKCEICGKYPLTHGDGL